MVGPGWVGPSPDVVLVVPLPGQTFHQAGIISSRLSGRKRHQGGITLTWLSSLPSVVVVGASGESPLEEKTTFHPRGLRLLKVLDPHFLMWRACKMLA